MSAAAAHCGETSGDFSAVSVMTEAIIGDEKSGHFPADVVVTKHEAFLTLTSGSGSGILSQPERKETSSFNILNKVSACCGLLVAHIILILTLNTFYYH